MENPYCSCKLTRVPTQDARIALALNGQQYTTEVHMFNFYDPDARPEVTGVTPVSGAMAGGKTITISGNNFADVASVACRIDGRMAEDENLASFLHEGETHPTSPGLTLEYQTVFVSSHEITCVTQPHYELRNGFPGYSPSDTTPDPTNNVPSQVDVTNGDTNFYSGSAGVYTFIKASLVNSVLHMPVEDQWLPDTVQPMPPLFEVQVMAGIDAFFLVESRDPEGERMTTGKNFFTGTLTQSCAGPGETARKGFLLSRTVPFFSETLPFATGTLTQSCAPGLQTDRTAVTARRRSCRSSPSTWTRR